MASLASAILVAGCLSKYYYTDLIHFAVLCGVFFCATLLVRRGVELREVLEEVKG
ncbi:hypothetical protein RintRC_7497 [Richelia intracellularis]|nr:hypothetical protein RintRC_7497 [Richelia intracellularis]